MPTIMILGRLNKIYSMRGLFTICLAVLSISASFAQKEKGYKISGKLNGWGSDDVFLAYHYGDKQYIKDTVPMDAEGNFTFQGEERLDGGIYLIVDPSKSYFEIIVADDQHFSFETDKDHYVDHMKMKGSKENEKFFEYINFLAKKNKEAEPLRKQLEELKDDSLALIPVKEKLNALDKEVKQMQKDYIAKNPDLFFPKVVKAQQEPEIPEAPLKEDGTKDDEFAWRYYKKHFFDNFDFTDDRILRSPVYHTKLQYFLDKVTVQSPDSLAASADYVCNLASANDEIFKYTVISITNKYAKSKIMGFDAVYVHMVNNYYKTGKATWTDEEQLKKITERVEKIEPMLLGKTAPDITMQFLDTKNFYSKSISLSSIEAEYTFLYFWDPTCGHCKKFTPKLYEWYQANKAKYDIKAYSVCTIVKIEDIDKYYEDPDHNYDWISTWDPFNKSGFRDKYDILSTPVFLILDKDKKIIAKKPNIEDLDGILERHSKNQEQVYKKMHEE